MIDIQRLWILKEGENYKSEQRLLSIDQLNYGYSNKFVHFYNFHLVSRYRIDPKNRNKRPAHALMK